VFLDFLRRRNPALLDCAAGLVADGAIEPDTYVIDLDAVEQNADRLLRAAADAESSSTSCPRRSGGTLKSPGAYWRESLSRPPRRFAGRSPWTGGRP
jgi:hypothetical protein